MPDVRCSAAAAPLHIRQAGSPAAGDPWARALPRPSRSQGKISSLHWLASIRKLASLVRAYAISPFIG